VVFEQVSKKPSLSGPVDLLLRPEDISIQVNDIVEGTKNIGKVFSMRYEGSSRLYQIEIGVQRLKVRTRHDVKLQQGQSVTLNVTITKDVTVFEQT
jgi:ABC-type sugar transport system ATPase subunit